MTRCVDSWRRWRKEPNFCGLSPQAISEIKAYLEIVDKIMTRGIPEELIYENFPEGAARPLIRASDDDTRLKALNYVISCLKRKERVTAGDLGAHIKNLLSSGAGCKVEKPSTHLRTKIPQDLMEKPAEPEAPPQSLGQQIRADEMRQADANQKHIHPGPAGINPVIINDTHRESPFKTAAQVKAGIAGEMFPDRVADPKWSPAMCEKGCPDQSGKNHMQKGQLGRKCDLTGGFITDIKLCPIIDRQRRAQAQPDIGTGNPQTLTIHFNNKQWAVLKQIQREGKADSFEEAVVFLVDEAGERMEGP